MSFMMSSLSRPIDKAILIYFRVCAGILMAQELINSLIIDKFSEYIDPQFHFSYLFFSWIRPWPQTGMIVHYAVTITAAYAVAAGIFYRYSAVILFLGQVTLFLMEMSEYINHHYLYCLISFWMIFLPLKKDHESTAPAWCLYILLFHISLAYFFGGIAKINPDWLAGTPMNLFLAARMNYPLGALYSQTWAPLFFSYGGIVFDLIIIPLMIFPNTKKVGLFASIIFHFSNFLMFGLATFPWFSLLMTSMFLNPSWPRMIPGFHYLLPPKGVGENQVPSRSLVLLLSLYIVIHTALPFRHYLYPGDPSWTEEGHMFSWRMMLRSKSGQVRFHVQNKTTKKIIVIDPKDYLTTRQINDMIGNPDMILQFAHFLRDQYFKVDKVNVAVYASGLVSLNGKKKRSIIKPGINLAEMERSLWPYNWINDHPQTK